MRCTCHFELQGVSGFSFLDSRFSFPRFRIFQVSALRIYEICLLVLVFVRGIITALNVLFMIIVLPLLTVSQQERGASVNLTAHNIFYQMNSAWTSAGLSPLGADGKRRRCHALMNLLASFSFENDIIHLEGT